MVVYDVLDQRGPGCTFTSTAYATLKGHWLRGEERVTVICRDGSHDVDVEILSVSKAGPSLWSKTIWPFVGTMQKTFFQQHLDHLAKTASTVDPDIDTANNFRFHHLDTSAHNNDDITISIGSPTSETSRIVPATSSSSSITMSQKKNKWSSRPTFLSDAPKLIKDRFDRGYDVL